MKSQFAADESLRLVRRALRCMARDGLNAKMAMLMTELRLYELRDDAAGVPVPVRRFCDVRLAGLYQKSRYWVELAVDLESSGWLRITKDDSCHESQAPNMMSFGPTATQWLEVLGTDVECLEGVVRMLAVIDATRYSPIQLSVVLETIKMELAFVNRDNERDRLVWTTDLYDAYAKDGILTTRIQSAMAAAQNRGLLELTQRLRNGRCNTAVATLRGKRALARLMNAVQHETEEVVA